MGSYECVILIFSFIFICVCSCTHASVCAVIWVWETAVQVLSWLLNEFVFLFFFGGGTTHRTPTPHPHHPLPLAAVLQGSLQMTECFCPAFEILVTFLSDAQPNNKGAFMLWSRLGKGIDKTVVGKDLSLCQVVHARDYQKDCIFLFRALWPCLFVYSCAREIHATVSQFWKGKRYDLLPHMASWPCFGPCYFWIDRI